MFSHVLDFLVDFFTNLNIKKIIGGIMALTGLWLVQMVRSAGDLNKGLIYAVVGIAIGSIGFLIIYIDIAKDKHGGGFDELGTLSKGYKQQEREKGKLTGWHMPEDTFNKPGPNEDEK